MEGYYLYGARRDDPRYLMTFQEDFGGVGEDFLSELQSKFANVDSKMRLVQVMQKGIDNAQRLANQQIALFGYSNVNEFCNDFNLLITNFEKISYRLLELLSTNIANDLVKNITNRTAEDAIRTVRNESKIMNAFSNDMSGKIGQFWDNVVDQLTKPTGEFAGYLAALVNARKSDIIERDFRYGSNYAGKLGELSNYIFLKAIDIGTASFFKELDKQSQGKNFTVEIVGTDLTEAGKQGKADTAFGILAFTIKNYSAIRNRFMGFGKAYYNPQPFPDITLQGSGHLESVIKNFEADTGVNIFPGDASPFYSYVMNALYYREFGIDEYYQIAMQALDILVNTYAYVFLVQGTTKNMGYMIEEITQTNKVLPGFMWLTGKGIVPIVNILEEIKHNFKIILTRTRSQGRSGIYAYLKLKGQKEATASVDVLKQRPVYSEDEITTNGLFYRKSFNSTTSPYQDVPAILEGRYKKFSEGISSSIKLNMQIGSIEKLINMV